MKLFLLRHAQAQAASPAGDRHRHLTQKGKLDALAMSKMMHDHEYIPEYAACSTATRAEMTLEGIREHLPTMKCHLAEELYSASAKELFDFTRHLPGAVHRALIISHNPGIHEFARLLAGYGHEERIQFINTSYPPCTLTVFNCPAARWLDLMPGQNELANVLTVSEEAVPAPAAQK